MNHPSILRVLKSDTVIGAAFLVTESLAATCAHVVKAAGQTEGGTVVLRLENGETVSAAVLNQYWRDDTNAEDIAILKLEKTLDGIQPLILGPSSEAKGHKFSTYGFPKPTQELHGTGDILDLASIGGMTWLQLHSSQVTPGFSGAPIIDEGNPYLKRVVGMVVSITPPDEYLRQNTTAFAIPSETLRQVCSDIPIETTFEALTEELLALPGMGAFDPSVIYKAYIICFVEEITHLPSLAGANTGVSQMIRHLGDATPSQDEQPRPLAYFAATLADGLKFSHPQLRSKILDWLKKHSGKLMIDPANLSALIRVDKMQVNPPCLQIAFERSLLNQPGEYPQNQVYKLKVRDGRANQAIFDDMFLKFGELASFIRFNALTRMVGRLASEETDQLWIEFVLKTEDLSRKVDCWASDEAEQTLGQKYKLVVRSLHRWEKRLALQKTWSGKWSMCKAWIVNQPATLKCDVVKETTAAAFQQKVEDLHVVGSPFELRDHESNGYLLTALLNSGVPVAVWVRQGTDPERAERWLQKHFVDHDHLDLRHLAEHVRRERQSGSELSGALVLLWDNYDRKLPEEDSFIAPPLQGEDVPW